VKTIFIVQDKHTGHRQGAVNPESKIKDPVPIQGRSTHVPVRVGAYSELIWECLMQMKDWVDTNYPKSDKYFMDLGEIVQGTLYKDDLLTTVQAEQMELARDVYKPFLSMKNMRAVRFMTATSWHEYGQGSASRLMAEQLKSEYRIDVDWMNRSRILIKDADVLLQFQHHGPGASKRKRLEGSRAFWEAHDRVLRHITSKKRCPDYVFSAHTHRQSKGTAEIFDEHRGEYIKSTHVIAPPLCGPAAFSRKIDHREDYVIGGNVLVTDGKMVHLEHFYKLTFDYTLEEI